MKKVAIIGTAGVPGKYGGFETLAHHLVLQLNAQFKLSVYCSNKFYSKEERVREWNGARLFYLPLNANGWQSILYDIISILHALLYADTLIVLGVSGGIIIPLVKMFTNKRIIVNIDGLEWRRAKWNKWIKKYLKLSEVLAVRYADADITDNASLKKYTAIYYKTLSHLIEYGADHATPRVLRQEDLEKYPFLEKSYAFKVCRIEPENNVHVVLEAFRQLEEKTFVMVGNWSNSEYGIRLKQEYGSCPNIHLLDPIYHQETLDKLRSNCYVYIHGHSAGGTNPSLVEAMHLMRPIIAFNVSYNQVTTEHQAFYFRDVESLMMLLSNKQPSEYMANAHQMKAIAHRRYTWEIISQKYASLVHSFDYRYSRPEVNSRFSSIQYDSLIDQGHAHLKTPKMFWE